MQGTLKKEHLYPRSYSGLSITYRIFRTFRIGGFL